jgi:hypothetical protein
VIETFHVETQSKQASHPNPKSNTSTVHNSPNPTPSPSKTSDVNSVQSTLTSKNKNKKKGKSRNREDKNKNRGYVIVAVDYFTKWAKVMPTFDNTGKTVALFIFNHIITRLGVPQAIFTDHGSHFRNFMMSELTEKLGLRHKNSTPYYPQTNG